MLTITLVQTAADKRAFYNFAWRVYHNDPCWVPHMWPQRKAYLDKRAAFFSYGEGDFWLARQGKEVVGTIGTAIDHARNSATNKKDAFFGFFEVLPDGYEVAAALWAHAREWAKERGMTRLRGPHSFTVSDEAGFLIEGFDTPPSVLMTHSPAYYAGFATRYGFGSETDSLAYRLDLSTYDFNMDNFPPVIHRIAERAKRSSSNTRIRNARLDEWDKEIELLHPVYNKALCTNTDSAPIELAEFRAQAEDLRPILDPEMVFIAEDNGQAVGFGLGIPNLTEALIHANGLRYPWDYVRLARARGRITSISFKILVIDPAYWGRGFDAVMYLEMGRAVIRKGYTWVDASLTSAGHPQTNRLATRLGAYVYKRYRPFIIEA